MTTTTGISTLEYKRAVVMERDFDEAVKHLDECIRRLDPSKSAGGLDSMSPADVLKEAAEARVQAYKARTIMQAYAAACFAITRHGPPPKIVVDPNEGPCIDTEPRSPEYERARKLAGHAAVSSCYGNCPDGGCPACK